MALTTTVGMTAGVRAARLLGWVLLLGGLSVLLRDVLLVFDTGRWVPMALGDIAGWPPHHPAWWLRLWISPAPILGGAMLLRTCRRG